MRYTIPHRLVAALVAVSFVPLASAQEKELQYPLPTAGQSRSDTIIAPSGEEEEVEIQRQSESTVRVGGSSGRRVDLDDRDRLDTTEELIEAVANATGMTEAIVGDKSGRATYQDEIQTESFAAFAGSFLDSDFMDGGVIDSGLSELSDRDNPFRTMVELSEMTEEERRREEEIYAAEQATTLGILIIAGIVYGGIDAYGTPRATYTINQSFHNNMYRATFDGLGNNVPKRGYLGVDFGVGVEQVFANERWGLDSSELMFTFHMGLGMYRGDLDSVRWKQTYTGRPVRLAPDTIAEGRRRERYQWRFTPVGIRASVGGTLSGGDIFSGVKYTRRLGQSRWAFTAGTEVVWFGGRRAYYMNPELDRIGFPTGVVRASGYGGSQAWENNSYQAEPQGVTQAFGASWPVTFNVGFTFGLPRAPLTSQRIDPELSLYTQVSEASR